MKRQRLLQLVARAAATQLASLPAARRADVLDGLALILAGKKDKELARYTAGLIRLAEEHEAKFFEQLTRDGAGVRPSMGKIPGNQAPNANTQHLTFNAQRPRRRGKGRTKH